MFRSNRLRFRDCLPISIPALFLIVVVGCENPADEKPRAAVSETSATPASNSSAVRSDSPAVSPLPTPSADALSFSGAGSRIDFTGSKVTGKHDGGFKTFAGSLELDDKKTEAESVAVEIDMSSTWSDADGLTNHLKSPDFFDVAKFNKSTFVSSEIKPAAAEGVTHSITGNFTFHGVTKSITFPATIEVKEGAATIKSEFVINRKDFGIMIDGKPDDLIRNEVVIKLDIHAAKTG
jgi:polyisoprenoid-binding protein YceI